MRAPNLEEEKTLKRWQMSTFSVMLFGYVGYYLCRKNITAALPLLADTFGYSKTDLGKIGSVALIVYGIGKLINGPLGDKIGGRKIFLIGMTGAIAANLLFAAGNSLTWFIIIWSLGHYFLSMGWGGLAKTVGAWCPPEKNGTVMGFISINFQFGGVVATLLSGAIVAAGYGWKFVFIIPAGILVLVFIWSFFASKAHPKDVNPEVEFPKADSKPLAEIHREDSSKPEEYVDPIEVMKSLFSIKLFRVLLVYSALTTILRSIFFFWTALLFTDIGLNIKDAIFKSAMFPLAGCIGTIFIGWYTDTKVKDGNRARMMWYMLTGLTICLIAMAFFSQAEQVNTAIIVTLTALSGFFLLGPYSMSSGALTLDIAGSRGAGTCTGLIDGIGYLAASSSIYLSGWMSETFGWTSVFYLLVFCSAMSTLCCILMERIHLAKIKANA
jgi:sugar phosphate permease